MSTSYAGRAPLARLVVVDSSDYTLVGRSFSLDRGTLRVGRRNDNDISIPEGAVSTVHAVFELRGTAWFCVDQGSTNGTWVNDERARPAVRLFTDAQIRIGGTTFRYVEQTGSTPGPSTPPPALPNAW